MKRKHPDVFITTKKYAYDEVNLNPKLLIGVNEAFSNERKITIGSTIEYKPCMSLNAEIEKKQSKASRVGVSSKVNFTKLSLQEQKERFLHQINELKMLRDQVKE